MTDQADSVEEKAIDRKSIFFKPKTKYSNQEKINDLERNIHSSINKKNHLQDKLVDLQKEKNFIHSQYNNLSAFASSSRWSAEIIWVSIFVGFIFDFLLWESIFQGRFDLGSFSTAATRASAIICSLAYAYVCSQLGIAAQIRSVRKNRPADAITNALEQSIYVKTVSKQTFNLWAGLFFLLSFISVLGRFTTETGSTQDHLLLSFVSVSIALVIATMAFQYHDIYDHYYRNVKKAKIKSEKAVDSCSKQIYLLDSKIKDMEWLVKNRYVSVRLCSVCQKHLEIS